MENDNPVTFNIVVAAIVTLVAVGIVVYLLSP
jgi:hypothetical protein